jgi:hypothetical protein
VLSRGADCIILASADLELHIALTFSSGTNHRAYPLAEEAPDPAPLTRLLPPVTAWDAAHQIAICLAIATQQAQRLLRGLERRSVVNGNIFNSKGVHVGMVTDDAVFGLKGQKLYDLKGSNIYKLNGDLVGHLPDARGENKRLDKATDKLFPEG